MKNRNDAKRLSGVICTASWQRRLTFALGLILVSSHASFMLSANTIASFEDPKVLDDWAIVNDTVMGGVSRSSVEQTEAGNLRFKGELSLQNNGGFVSIRSRPKQLSLQGSNGITLSVRGDGRTYYLDLRSGGQSMGGSFRASFTTLKNEWTEVFIPLSNFIRQSFGRRVPNSILDPESISSIGFTLSDKKPGPFELEVEFVKSVRNASTGNSETERSRPSELGPTNQPRALIELAISKGVPLFNEGNEAACAAIYEVACAALITMPEISDTSVDILRQALSEIETVPSEAQKAWVLRYALDDTLRRLARSGSR